MRIHFVLCHLWLEAAVFAPNVFHLVRPFEELAADGGEAAGASSLAPKVSASSQLSPELRRMLIEVARLDDAGATAWLEANLDNIEKAFAS